MDNDALVSANASNVAIERRDFGRELRNCLSPPRELASSNRLRVVEIPVRQVSGAPMQHRLKFPHPLTPWEIEGAQLSD